MTVAIWPHKGRKEKASPAAGPLIRRPKQKDQNLIRSLRSTGFKVVTYEVPVQRAPANTYGTPPELPHHQSKSEATA